ncbi:anthranilate synthase [Acetobacter orientalis]|uniref:Anthranilate synthase n=1 Tax=Acetobacter orientalis TaxID=146474 RepID=A0A2Z5ZFB3_9PROT|nr:anthranilate synthase [Acetobacter orientalis]
MSNKVSWLHPSFYMVRKAAKSTGPCAVEQDWHGTVVLKSAWAVLGTRA